MKKEIIFLLVFLIFLTACTKRTDIFIDNGAEKILVEAEIANTPEKMERGLMFRESLDENAGMLFVFGQEAVYTFWMKNTLIPLDIIFISKDFIVVEIAYAQPCTEEPCEGYTTKKPAKYVLEVNQNFAIKNKIKEGDTVIIDEKVIRKLLNN